MSDLTQDRLKELLSYDPDTGVFRWIITGRKGHAGKIAGTSSRYGYTQIRVLGVIYFAHRLAWLYEYGYFPEHEIDHKNGLRKDNRIHNLRHVTRGCNLQNQKVNKSNKSGFPGVSWQKRDSCWRARVKIRRREESLGLFTDPLEAALARFNFEVVDPRWTCNHRSELAKAIKAAWPEFKGHHV